MQVRPPFDSSDWHPEGLPTPHVVQHCLSNLHCEAQQSEPGCLQVEGSIGCRTEKLPEAALQGLKTNLFRSDRVGLGVDPVGCCHWKGWPVPLCPPRPRLKPPLPWKGKSWTALFLHRLPRSHPECCRLEFHMLWLMLNNLHPCHHIWNSGLLASLATCHSGWTPQETTLWLPR